MRGDVASTLCLIPADKQGWEWSILAREGFAVRYFERIFRIVEAEEQQAALQALRAVRGQR